MRRDGLRGAAGLVVEAVRRHQVDRRQVPGLGLVGLALRGFQVVAGQVDLRVAGLGLRGPGVDVGRLRAGDGRLGAQAHQFVDRLAGDLLQRGAPDLQVALCGDLGRGGQVVARLGVVGIDDGGGADLEVALGLFQLLADCLLLRARQVQVVLRGKHVEVGLRGARDQVELGLVEGDFARHRRQLALLVGFPAVPAEQRLAQLQLPVVVVEETRARSAGRAVDRQRGGLVELCAVGAGGADDLRQQPGAALRQPLARGEQLRAGAGELRVIGLRIAIDLQQVGRARRCRGQQGKQRGEQGSRDRQACPDRSGQGVGRKLHDSSSLPGAGRGL
ncbi:hypothetical protein D9M72_436920 [compost metagenome]